MIDAFKLVYSFCINFFWHFFLKIKTTVKKNQQKLKGRKQEMLHKNGKGSKATIEINAILNYNIIDTENSCCTKKGLSSVTFTWNDLRMRFYTFFLHNHWELLLTLPRNYNLEPQQLLCIQSISNNNILIIFQFFLFFFNIKNRMRLEKPHE